MKVWARIVATWRWRRSARPGSSGAPIAAVLALACVAAGCSRSTPDAPAASATPALPRVDPSVVATDWPSYGKDPAETHFAAATAIDGASVGKLALAWHVDLEPGFTVSEPLVAGGRMFLTTGHSHIRALDPVSGKQLWEYDAKVSDAVTLPLQLAWGNKGLAYWDGRVVLATADGRVIALDAATGAVRWQQREFDAKEVRYINGPPRIFAGKVIIGHGGADLTAIHGYVTAYDVNTGQRLWRFDTVPGDPARPPQSKAEAIARPTWKGEWFGKGGGGTAWNAFSYDPDTNLLYLGIGNGFPYAQKLRSPGGGDNLFLASIVAVDATTGEYRWHYQVCPAEQWDCTATMDMTLANLTIDGRPLRALIQAPKNGFVYVLDRTNGKFISAAKFAKVTWAQGIDPKTGRPIENPGIRYERTGKMFELWPGPQGAHSWLPQAYSPQTGLVYIPVLDVGAMIGPAKPGPGAFTQLGATVVADADLPGSRRSYLEAWDPVRQRAAWKIDLPGDWPGGVLATGGGLVFQGRIDHRFVAYDARTGKEVWSFTAQSPIVAPPISYTIKGRQYVTVLTGSSSQGGGLMAKGNAAYNTDYHLPRHVLTFALGGTDALPAFTAPPHTPPADPDYHADPALNAKGALQFATNGCIVCHGIDAVGGGAAPDLRWSPVIADAAAFQSVLKGALKANGMPAFPQIADQDLEAIRFYLRGRARQFPADDARAKAGHPAPATGGAYMPLPRHTAR